MIDLDKIPPDCKRVGRLVVFGVERDIWTYKPEGYCAYILHQQNKPGMILVGNVRVPVALTESAAYHFVWYAYFALGYDAVCCRLSPSEFVLAEKTK